MILLQVLQYTKASKHHQIVIFFKYTEIAMILITGFVLGSHIGVSVVYALLKMGKSRLSSLWSPLFTCPFVMKTMREDEMSSCPLQYRVN